MDKFEKARQSINEIDIEMAKLFEKRMEAVRDVAEYKKEKGLPTHSFTSHFRFCYFYTTTVTNDTFIS